MPPDAIKINANENPLGPCPEALEAIHKIAKNGGRYLYEETFGFREILAEPGGVKANYMQPYPGSGAPLHRAVLAFISRRPFVTPTPGTGPAARRRSSSGRSDPRAADRRYATREGLPPPVPRPDSSTSAIRTTRPAH
jgi:hypothetical protein